MFGFIFLWLLVFFLLIFLISLVVYQLMCLADLEFDYINPYDSSARINRVVLPEFALQAALTLLFLLSWHWGMFLICVPNLYYNVTQYQKKKHLVDVTEIFNQLNMEKKIRLIKTVYLIVLLFMSMFWLIWDIVED
ncbi:ER-derived vesicles protein ERV14 [Zostera marina]|uniref:ER-derived vesicles protein ERV14 n=1 Tax=Zostera marina TaxID=29655 RepID=A0A0K9PCM6_ZOSMR|nr:ER-derived vesicles protein ERV14 [Zostera marina]